MNETTARNATIFATVAIIGTVIAIAALAVAIVAINKDHGLQTHQQPAGPTPIRSAHLE